MPSSTKASKQVKSSGAMTSRVDINLASSNRQSFNSSDASSIGTGNDEQAVSHTSCYTASAIDIAQLFQDAVKHIMSAANESKKPNDLPSLSTASPKSKRQQASKLAYISVKEVWETHGYKISESSAAQEVSHHDEYLFVVRTRIDKNTNEEVRYLDVKSQTLRELLRTTLKDVRIVSLQEDKLSVQQNILFSFLPQLEKHVNDMAQEQSENQYDCEHIRVFLDYLNTEFTPTSECLQRLLEKNEITYDLLWTIFSPNTEVYTTCSGTKAARCVRLNYGEETQRMDGSKYFELNCRYLDFNGEMFGEASTLLQIDEFRGTKPIHSLSSYPLAYHYSADQTKQELIQNGRTFITLMGVHQRIYEGQAFHLNKKGDIVSVFVNNSRIMVDPAFFFKKNPNYRSGKVTFLREDEDSSTPSLITPGKNTQSLVRKIDKDLSDLSDRDLLICSHCVRGFSFDKNMWLEFAVVNISEITWSDASFDLVAISDEKKAIVQALCAAQLTSMPDSDDFVAGKGRGLVALLHGRPGTGKTLTVEAMAEHLHRPLYLVSAGNLGVTVQDVEHHLSEILDTASHWRAILLLDEADIFVEQRTLNDLHRNALVCVFLRRLEYYQGIIFLTTNRVTTIDDAIASRIHAPILYPSLNEAARKKVWASHLARAATKYGEPDCGPKLMKDLSRKILNGREIRNVVSAARAMAEYNETVVNQTYLEKAIMLGQQFQIDFRGAGSLENEKSYL